MSRWFRFYDDAMNDPKLLRLSDEVFRAWIVLLCVASKNGGALPVASDIALMLRMKQSKVAEWITVLFGAGLLDKVEGGGFAPHNWDGRQYQSDSSTKRVKDFRERKKQNVTGNVTGNVPCNVTGNVSTAVSETALTEQSRADTEQSRADAPRAVVSGSEKALRSDLMEVFPNAPNYDRTSVWLGKGYAPSMIVEVVKELLARKPDVANLAYFDAALAERHAKRAETPSERAAAPVNLDSVVKLYAATGVWSRYAGPEPGLGGCRASPELLAKHGLAPDGRKLVALAVSA